MLRYCKNLAQLKMKTTTDQRVTTIEAIIKRVLAQGWHDQIPRRDYSCFRGRGIPAIFKKMGSLFRNRKERVTISWTIDAPSRSSIEIPSRSNPEDIQKLIPAKIHRWTIKEYQGIAKKIASLHEKDSIAESFRITISKEKEQVGENWEELSSQKAERQFYVSRITNMFS